MISKLLINLHNRPERLVNTIKELRKVGLSDNIIRIEACTPEEADEIKYEYLSKLAFNNIKNVKSTTIIPNLNALACAKSHIKCWQYMIDYDIKEAYIIEDDIHILNAAIFKLDMNYILNEIRKNLKNISKKILITFNSNKLNNDLFQYYPGYAGESEPSITWRFINNQYTNTTNIINNSNNSTYCSKIEGPIIGTHFYYINNNMAKLLLKNTKTLTYQIDITIGLLARKLSEWGKIIFMNYHTKSIKQTKKFESDIQYYNMVCLHLVFSLFSSTIHVI